jgi:hypothetical protein
MPRLKIFAACEKIIVDQDTNSCSLICLIEGITLSIPPNSTHRLNIGAPLHWELMSLWFSEPGDERYRFEQRIQVFAPDGTPTKVDMTMPFSFSDKKKRMFAKGFWEVNERVRRA